MVKDSPAALPLLRALAPENEAARHIRAALDILDAREEKAPLPEDFGPDTATRQKAATLLRLADSTLRRFLGSAAAYGRPDEAMPEGSP